MRTNVIKSVLSAVIISLLLVVTGCQKSPYDKAINLIHELSEEVTTVTNMQAYDAVYNKIVNLKSNALITNLTNLSDTQKQELTVEMTNLTMKALTVKAILYVMPSSVTPTSDDINKLCKECMDQKANVVSANGYPEVKAIVKEYFKDGN